MTMDIRTTRRAVLLGGSAMGLLVAVPATAAIESADARLNAFFEDAFRTAMARYPEWQAFLGVPDARHDLWNDLSEPFEAETQRLEIEGLATLRRGFDPAALSPAGRLNYRLWEYRAAEAIDGYRWRNHDYELEHFNGRHSGMPSLLINVHPLRRPQDVEAWITRVVNVGTAVDQLIEAAERRATAGIIPPRFALEKSLAATRGTLSGAPFEPGGADSALWSDVKNGIAGLDLDAGRKADLSVRAQAALTDSFGPAYRRLAGYIESLAARADDRDGVWKLPDGEAYYAWCIKRHTTLDLTADEVHRIGLDAVDRIHRDMHTIMKQVGWTGDLQSFFRHLRTDPQFYFPDTPDGHAAYLAEAERIVRDVEKVLDGQFGVKPSAPVTVQRFELFREASEAIARYSPPASDGTRPGTYYVNLSNMREMPRFQMEVLAFHEAIPGHHMQIAIAQEMTDLPRFRRFSMHTAYVEGWGLYSERLPKELGFYRDPYSDFGRLTFELWRAIRLVVDTGIHAKRWTRAQAIDYFVGNSAVPRESAEREIDRYIVWPGQALAYYLGMLKILELRDRARAALGNGFDIRSFHDTVLSNGSVPLPILEEIVDGWIAARRT